MSRGLKYPVPSYQSPGQNRVSRNSGALFVAYDDSATVKLTLTPSTSAELYTPGVQPPIEVVNRAYNSDLRLQASHNVVSHREFADTATATLTLTPSGTDTADFVDSATALLVLTPSAADTAQFVDAATVTLVLTPSGTEVLEGGDIGTAALTFTPSGTDTADFVDSNTVSLLLTPSGTDTQVVSPPQINPARNTPYNRPGLSQVSQNKAPLTQSASTNYTDSATATLALTPSAADTAQFVDAATAVLVLTPSGVEEGFTDFGSAVLTLTPSAVETADFVDSGTALVALTPSGSDTLTSGAAPSTITPRNVPYNRLGLVTKSVNVAPLTQPSQPPTVDSDTALLTLTPSGTDTQAGGTDADTIILLLTPDAVETFVRIQPIIQQTNKPYQTPGLSKASRNAGSLRAAPVFVDFVQVNFKLTPSGTEGLGANNDAATVNLTLTPSAVNIHYGTPVPGAYRGLMALYVSEVFAGGIDTATVNLFLTPSAVETGQLVDSGTATLKLTPSAVEVVERVDAGTVSLKLTPSSADIEQYTESATALVKFTPSATEQTPLLDTATVGFKLSPSSSDTLQGVDAFTVKLALTPTAVEIFNRPGADADTLYLRFSAPTASEVYYSFDTLLVATVTRHLAAGMQRRWGVEQAPFTRYSAIVLNRKWSGLLVGRKWSFTTIRHWVPTFLGRGKD